VNWKWKPRTSVLSNTCPWKWTIVFEECKKPQTVATSEAFFQYSFATQIQKKSFYSKKKRFEYRRKRVNSEANFRAMYTWRSWTSISVQRRGSRERWFGNNSLLGGFWGIRVTWLGFHSNSPLSLAPLQLLWNMFLASLETNSTIKIKQVPKSKEDYIWNLLVAPLQ